MNRDVKAKIAKGHLQEVGSLLSEIDPKLSDVAFETPNEDNEIDDDAASVPQSNNKRKSIISSNDDNADETNEILFVPKKKNKISGSCASGEGNLTLTQQEEIAMNNLIVYIEKCGGEILFLQCIFCVFNIFQSFFCFYVCGFLRSNLSLLL